MISLFSRNKNARGDGEATRLHILETAVRLFAEHGYAETTSKMICREAGVNIASVNYYFGSREDLYRTVLEEVHERIVNERHMGTIMEADCSAEKKLEMVLDAYIETAYSEENWYSRIWAHELISPSPMGGVDFLTKTRTKERLIARLLSEMTGIPMEDPALSCCVVTVMAPYLLMLFVHHDMAKTLVPIFHYSSADMNQHFKRLIIDGVRSFAERYARGEVQVGEPLTKAEAPEDRQV